MASASACQVEDSSSSLDCCSLNPYMRVAIVIFALFLLACSQTWRSTGGDHGRHRLELIDSVETSTTRQLIFRCNRYTITGTRCTYQETFVIYKE